MKIKNLIYSAITGALLFTQACKPDEYSLDAADISSSELAEGIAFEIVHDASNYNLVHLKSLVDSKYQCIWETPQGRFQNATVDLKMPFEGKYPIVFGVETRGGIVYSDTAWFDIKEFYAEFVSDPLWKLISGGAGESKTWYLDIDEEGVSRYWTGPVCYYGLDNSWETEMEGKEPTGTDVWSWFPDYKGNTWIVSELKNFGSMTFDLNGGAHLTIKDADGNVTASGVYSIDAEKHTMTTSDATIIHCNFDDIVLKWGNIKIIKADENSMQLAVVRDNSSEGECLLAFSYISEDYYNNWTPGETEEKPNEPQLPENWKQDISEVTITTTSIKWTLSDKNPLDWANLDGSLMNGWKAPEDYPDWLGTPNYDDYKDFSMTLNSADNTVKFVTPDGTETSGTYSIDDKGIFTFEGVSVPSFTVVGWASFAADANGQLRILSIEKDAFDKVTGMWLGAKSSEKEEYMAYHLVCSAGTSSDAKKYKAQMWLNSSSNWDGGNTDIVISEDGEYTFVKEGEYNGDILYLDFLQILPDNPNFSVTIKSIIVDGNELTFDETKFTKEYVSNWDEDKKANVIDETSFRRYIANPWGNDDDIASESLDIKESIKIVITVKFDSGTSAVPTE